jgi:hypothetical protein
MATHSNLGTDGDWLRGPVTSRFPWVTGRLALAKSLARRLMQPANSLKYWPGYGEDIGALVESNASMDDIRMYVERQFEREPRISRSTVTPTQDSDGEVRLYCVITDSDGTFETVMSASQAAVKLVSLQGQAVDG